MSLLLPSCSRKKSVGFDSRPTTPNKAISISVPGLSFLSELFLFAAFPVDTQVVFYTVDDITAEWADVPSLCNDQTGRLQDAEEEVSHARTVKTALVEWIKTLELENWCPGAEMESLQLMMEDAFSTGFYQKRKKCGYILSTFHVKYVSIATKLLDSVWKIRSRQTSETYPFSRGKLKR